MLGEGGMGSVWLAWDSNLERNVALKEMHTGVLTTEGEPLVSSARVLREARAASRLRHPNIVSILELIEGDDGPLIVMEYVEGKSLANWIERRPETLSESRAAEIGLAVLDALVTAHAERVWHRDVKPANILIQRAARPDDPLGGRVRLIDFGNAAIEGYAMSTRSALVGTPGFVAPERFSGRSGGEADLWSLGVTLYQAVEHRLPFQRDQPEQVMYALLYEDPDPLSRARRLAPVITGLLDKDPDRRLDARTARAMLGAALAEDRPGRRDGTPSTRTGHTGAGRGSRAGAETGSTPGGRDEPGRGKARKQRPPNEPTPSAPVSGFAAIVARNPEEAVALLLRQGPRSAARALDRLAAGSDEAITMLTLMRAAFAAEMLAHARPASAAAALCRLDPRRAARLLGMIPAGGAAPVLAALTGDDPATVRIVQALPHQVAGLLFNGLGLRQAIALLGPLEPTRAAGILAQMSPRRAAAVLDHASKEPGQAAALVEAIPYERIGAILDQMDARRVAGILLVHPDQAAGFLRRMSLPEQRRVMDHLG